MQIQKPQKSLTRIFTSDKYRRATRKKRRDMIGIVMQQAIKLRCNKTLKRAYIELLETHKVSPTKWQTPRERRQEVCVIIMAWLHNVSHEKLSAIKQPVHYFTRATTRALDTNNKRCKRAAEIQLLDSAVSLGLTKNRLTSNGNIQLPPVLPNYGERVAILESLEAQDQIEHWANRLPPRYAELLKTLAALRLQNADDHYYNVDEIIKNKFGFETTREAAQMRNDLFNMVARFRGGQN